MLARFWAGIVSVAVLSGVSAMLVLAVVPPALGSWTATVVGSGSMRPALSTGDVVLLEPVPGSSILAPGAVVLVDVPAEEVDLLHRVVAVDGGAYTTQGDANPTPDSDPVGREQVRGAGRLLVPAVGTPVLWLHHGRLLPLAALGVLVAALCRLARYGWSDEHDPWRADRPDRADHRGPPEPLVVPRPLAALSHRVPAGAALGLAVLVAAAASSGAPAARAAFSTTSAAVGSVSAGLVAPPSGLSASTRCGAATSAPSVITSASATRAGSTLTLRVPAAAAAGDLLLAHVVVDSVASAPAGFSLLQDTTGASLQAQVYQRVATAADAGTSYAWTSTGAVGTAGLVVVRGASGPVDPGAGAGTYFASTTAVVTPSLVVTTPRSLLLLLVGTRQTGSPGQPGGVSTVYSSTASGVSLAAASETRASTGPTGTRTFNTAAAPAVGQSLLVAPAPRVLGVDLSWTASPSASATGYDVARGGGAPVRISPRTATTYADNTPGTGPRTYTVTSVAGSWRSTGASVTTTPSCL